MEMLVKTNGKRLKEMINLCLLKGKYNQGLTSTKGQMGNCVKITSEPNAILVENGGGAIFRNCIIKNNGHHNNGSGQLDGAGIKVHQQGKLILDRTKVLDNYTENTGGGEFHRGVGVYADNSAIYVINSIIADNYTASWNNGSSNYGSGLYAWNAELAIINSTITGNQGIANQSSGSGTALEIGGSDGEQIVIFNSIIAVFSNSSLSLSYWFSSYSKIARV